MSDLEKKNLFRQKTLDRISSPEQLSDYLRVTNPGIWTVLVAVILLLSGILAWSMIGTLETTADAHVIVEDHTARVATDNAQKLAEGMTLRVNGQEYEIAATQADDYGRLIGISSVDLPDGTYNAVVVTEAVQPISFLLESR